MTVADGIKFGCDQYKTAASDASTNVCHFSKLVEMATTNSRWQPAVVAVAAALAAVPVAYLAWKRSECVAMYHVPTCSLIQDGLADNCSD